MIEQWTYKILVDSDPPRIVHPINDKEIIFLREKQDDEKIFYDRKLKNKFKFSNRAVDGIDDFDYFYSFESSALLRCKEFKIQLFRRCNGVDVLNWQGKFSLTDGDWDLDQCTFEVKPEPDTIYTCLKNNKNKEVNILDVPTIISTSTNLSYNYEFYYCIGFGTSCSFPGVQTATWTKFYQNYNYQYIKNCSANNINIQIWYREAIITACIGTTPNPPPGSGWLLEANNCATTATCKWVRTPLAGLFPYISQVAVGWYNFILGQEELPPYPKFKTLTVSNTPASEELKYYYPIIWYSDNANTYIDWYFSVENNPNSTYVWSLDGSSPCPATVTGTTNECKIRLTTSATGTVVLKLTETHGNASVSTKLYTVGCMPIGPLNTGGTFGNPVSVLGPRNVCKNQTNIIFSVPKQPDVISSGDPTKVMAISAINWAVTGGATIASGQGTRFVNITSGTSSFQVTASWTITASSTIGPTTIYTISFSTPISITVADIPVTDDIFTIINRYPSEPGLDMSLCARAGATYDWYNTVAQLSTGTLISNRNVYSFTTPAGLGSHCYLVKETVSCTCTSYLKIAPATANFTVGFFPPVYWCSGSSISSSVVYTRNREFKEVIEYLVDQLACDVNGVVSDFFGWNPPGDTPGYVAGYNYVTTDPNMLINMTIAQKSDIISYSSSNAATKGMITLEKLEKIWAWKFNAYWFIDSFNRFRIEHISWFNRSVAYNANVAPHATWNTAKNKYTYNKDQMPKFEVFKDSEMMFTDFVGTAIYYDSICVNQDSSNNTKERFLDFVTTDLYSLYIDPASANKVGFVLMVNDKVGSVYTVASEVGAISGNTIANGHLAWANLHVAYHKYNRVLIQGYMNNILTTFVSAKPTRKQKDVAIKVCCDDVFDPLIQLYKTQIGDGILADGEENMKTGIIKMTLNHD